MDSAYKNRLQNQGLHSEDAQQAEDDDNSLESRFLNKHTSNSVPPPPAQSPERPKLQNTAGSKKVAPWEGESPGRTKKPGARACTNVDERIARGLQLLHRFFSVDGGEGGNDPTVMFGNEKPTDEELTDFLKATSPRTAEDILAHFYGAAPQLDFVPAPEQTEGREKPKRRSSFKKDKEREEDTDTAKGAVLKRSLTWADQEQGEEVPELPTREEANERLTSFMHMQMLQLNGNAAVQLGNQGSGNFLTPAEFGEQNVNLQEASAIAATGQPSPIVTLPIREHIYHSNSLQEVHHLEKSYYLPEGWAGVPKDTLTEFAAEGTLAGAGLLHLQSQSSIEACDDSSSQFGCNTPAGAANAGENSTESGLQKGSNHTSISAEEDDRGITM